MFLDKNTTDEASAGHVLLRIEKVLEMCGKSRNQVYLDVRKGKFPRPVKIGDRAAAWVRDEIQAWIAERIAARDAAAVA